MDKQKINFIVNLGVFPFDVMVSIGQSDKQLCKNLDDTGMPFDKQDIDNLKYTSNKCKGRYVLFSNNASLIRIRNLPSTPNDYGTLSHEIFHAVSIILDHLGVKLVIETSCEVYAYCIGYLTENIYKEINKYY